MYTQTVRSHGRGRETGWEAITGADGCWRLGAGCSSGSGKGSGSRSHVKVVPQGFIYGLDVGYESKEGAR